MASVHRVRRTARTSSSSGEKASVQPRARRAGVDEAGTDGRDQDGAAQVVRAPLLRQEANGRDLADLRGNVGTGSRPRWPVIPIIRKRELECRRLPLRSGGQCGCWGISAAAGTGRERAGFSRLHAGHGDPRAIQYENLGYLPGQRPARHGLAAHGSRGQCLPGQCLPGQGPPGQGE
jgi:hypothetical protein